MSEQYGNQSISSLKGADRVRLRPSVIFGSDGIDGCKHTVTEILANSIDEFKDGYGNIIIVTRYEDYSYSIRDFGRGVPLDWNEKEQRYNWELIFNELYAGGKYKTSGSEDTYEFSLGLNGLGATSVCYSSSFFHCDSYRDGYKYSIDFKEGVVNGQLNKEECKYDSTGTFIQWKPDNKVFTETDIPMDWIKEVCKKQTIVNPNLKIIIKDEVLNEESYTLYENGIQDYIKEKNTSPLSDFLYFSNETKGRDSKDRNEYKVKYEVAFVFTNTETSLEYYHNSSFLEYGGSPDKAVKNGFVSSFDKYLKSSGLYTKDEKKVTFVDIQDSLSLIVNSYSTQTSYENQTKKAITNKFIQDTITEGIKDFLEVYFKENPIEAEKIGKQILANKRSREKAEKTRINVRKQLSGTIDIANRIKKFVDCRSKDTNKRELYIVEGDSALGSCKLGRNAEFQAIMPVRGKILNCLKADYEKIFKSDIIVDLLKVLGCGIEIKSKKNKDLNTFDINNLKWSKIIICTDADVDGYQIRTLIITMIYVLAPTLIKEGKVFIADTPLYEITNKGKTYFAFNDDEKEKLLPTLSVTVDIQRSKGLGENEPEMMWETTMNPETRHLIRVDMSYVDDEAEEYLQEVQDKFDVLLGEDLQGRREVVASGIKKYSEVIDCE